MSTDIVAVPAIPALDAILAQTALVLERHQVLAYSQSDALTAEAAVLDAAIARVRTVLPTIAAKLEASYVRYVGCDGGIDQETHFPRRGLVLAGEGMDRVGLNMRQVTRGPIEGDALVLWEDGTLGRLTYAGSWTYWEREADRMEATSEVVTTREALDQYEFATCLRAITEALTAVAGALGDVHTKAATLRRRSEALQRAAEALRAP